MQPFPICAGVLALAPLVHGGVTVVAPVGGEHTSISAAIAAAPEDEIVLVRSGFYGAFTISDKSVHVVADAGATVNVSANVTVQSLSAGKRVTLQGLRIAQGNVQPALWLQGCAGSVRVIATTSTPPFPMLGGPSFPPPAAEITGCADVAFDRCELTGTAGAWFGLSFGSLPADGVEVHGATVAFHDSTVRGGRGYPGHPVAALPNAPGGPGAHAGLATTSSIFVSGGAVRGGDGGPGINGATCTDPYLHPTSGGQGGRGVALDAASTLVSIGGSVSGGAGGASGSAPGCTLPPGPDGPAATGGTHSTIAGAPRRLDAIAPAREGGSAQLHFEGQPGDDVFLALTIGRAHELQPVLHGVLLVLSPFRRLRVGTIDGTGVLDVDLPVGPIAAVDEGFVRNAQAIFRDVNGERWTSGAALLTLLDDGF
jgi:hypothetical protein